MNILTVDDDAVVRRTLAEILKTESDWKITDADDGEVAWQMLDNGLEADICILDNVMPRLTGIELLKRMRGDERFKTTPVILVTLNRDRGLVVEAIKHKVSGFILKPFEASRVLRQVQELASSIPKHKSEPNVVLEDPEEVINRLQIDYRRYLVMLDIFIEDLQKGVADVRKLIDGSDVLAAISRIDAMKGACVTLGANRFKKVANSISQVTVDSVSRLDSSIDELKAERERIAALITEKGLANSSEESDAGGDEAQQFNTRVEILLVEDKPAIVKQFKDNLTSNSWKFTIVASEREATSYVLQSTPSLIIMSLSLPNEGAFEAIRFLRSNTKTRKIPVYGMAVKTAHHEHRKAEESGFTSVITKPVDFPELQKRLVKVLNIETASSYFHTEDERLIINLPASADSSTLEEIDSSLSARSMEAIDNGCSKVVVNGAALNDANQEFIEFLLHAEKVCESNSLLLEVMLSKELEEKCKAVEDCKELKFIESLEASAAVSS